MGSTRAGEFRLNEWADESVCCLGGTKKHMNGKQVTRWAVLGMMSVVLAGCVVKVGGDGDGEESRRRHELSKTGPPTEVVVPANTEDSATMAEIGSVSKLSFDAGRVPVLRNIAARPALGPATQVHLVNTTLKHLSFDAGKIDVLLTLIENPDFSAAGKETILRQIDRLNFDASRSQIIAAIQARGAKAVR